MMYRPILKRAAILPVAVLATALMAGPVLGAEQAASPVPTPPGSRAYSAGESLVLNGTSVSARLFGTAGSTSDVIDWYDRQFGAPISRHANGRVEARAYLTPAGLVTLQVQPALEGSRGLVAISAAHGVSLRSEDAPPSRRWLGRMPSGTRLLMDLRSRDGGQHAHQMVFANPQGLERNREVVVQALAAEGMSLERDVALDAGAGGRQAGQVLHFQGDSRQAVATLQQGREGTSLVVLTLLRQGSPPQ